MRLAVAQDGTSVSAHFGHCEGFALYEGEGNEVRHVEDLANVSEHSTAGEILAARGVTHLIAGGMGQRARTILQQHGIETILGVTGQTRDAAAQFFAGTLTGDEILCTESGCHAPDAAGSCTCSCHQHH